MAVDLAATITYLKDVGFSERSLSLRQAWEVDVHPEEACEGPLDLHLALDVDPRLVIRLEDLLNESDDVPEDPDGSFTVPFIFNWSLPPLGNPPDLIVLAAELAGIGGVDLPIEISAVDTFGALSDHEDRHLSIVGRRDVSLVDLMFRQEQYCDVLDRVHEASMYLVSQSTGWMP